MLLKLSQQAIDLQANNASGTMQHNTSSELQCFLIYEIFNNKPQVQRTMLGSAFLALGSSEPPPVSLYVTKEFSGNLNSYMLKVDQLVATA